MNEIICAAVYLILALAVAVGIRAVYLTGPRKKPDSVTADTRSPRAAAIENTKRAQRQHPSAQYEHALPWVIPTALAPAGTGVETKKAATPVKTISERLKIIELRLDRISRHLAGGQLGLGPLPSTPSRRPANHSPSIPSPAITARS
jgi:hypothetical protein